MSVSSFLPPNDEFPDVDRRTCRLLGPTALVVQGLTGTLVISSLVYKRYREKPRRPWRIWSFDVSKQMVGQLYVHGLNILVSDLVAHRAAGNPCVLYFLNILIDTTFGVAIIYFSIRMITGYLVGLHFQGFQSGHYGDPPSILFWLRQTTVYIFALTIMKTLVIGLFALWPGIFRLGDWLLSWTGDGDLVQVIFVMGLFPISMNILQFWIIDSIVKNKDNMGYSNISPSRTPRQSSDQEPLFNQRELENGVIHPHDADAAAVGVSMDNPEYSPSSNNSSMRTDSEERKSLQIENTQYSSGSEGNYPPSTSTDVVEQALPQQNNHTSLPIS